MSPEINSPFSKLEGSAKRCISSQPTLYRCASKAVSRINLRFPSLGLCLALGMKTFSV